MGRGVECEGGEGFGAGSWEVGRLCKVGWVRVMVVWERKSADLGFEEHSGLAGIVSVLAGAEEVGFLCFNPFCFWGNGVLRYCLSLLRLLFQIIRPLKSSIISPSTSRKISRQPCVRTSRFKATNGGI